jgi:two-component system LytT family response regulator
MIKTIIIDDEKLAVNYLRLLLNEYCKNIEILGSACSIKEGVELVNKTKPDLVFLDIEMPFGTGFDLLSKLDKIDFQVIFVTAYNQYAIQAIKCNALDYILKPIDIDELKKAVSKVDIKEKSNDRIDSLLASVKSNNSPTRIALADDGGYTMVNIDSIIRCEASGYYTIFHIENTKIITVSRTLKQFEELLPKDKFIRVHQSHLINVNKVEKYYKTDGGYLLMSDASSVSVSRRKKEEINKKFLM